MAISFSRSTSRLTCRKSSKMKTYLRRRALSPSRRCCRQGRRKPSSNASSKPVAERLEALKRLIPSVESGEAKKKDLFEETADYILRLRTQVEILKHLLDLYGGGEGKKEEMTMP